MVEFEETPTEAKNPRIQWTDTDVEAFGSRRPSLHRVNSNSSLSGAHSRRGSIDPASALPITYRTVSFQIAESKEKSTAEVQKAKDSAAKGMYLAPLHPPKLLTPWQNSRTSTGTLYLTMKSSLVSLALLHKVFQQNKPDENSPSMARTRPLLPQRITSNRYSDTSLEVLVLSS
jgi:hypothetical protein